MLMRRQATSPVERVQSSPFDRGQRGLERFGRTADAAELELRVFEEAEVGAAFAHRKMRGEMPVGAERVDAELSDAQRLVRVRSFAERQKDVGAERSRKSGRIFSRRRCAAGAGGASYR